MNGIRQPQLAKAAGAIVPRAMPMTASAMKKPTVAVVWIQLVA